MSLRRYAPYGGHEWTASSTSSETLRNIYLPHLLTQFSITDRTNLMAATMWVEGIYL